MSTPTPIRPDVEPATDLQRDLRDYAWMKISEYCTHFGEPAAIAFVLVGQDHGETHTVAYSWSVGGGENSRLHTCSVAATVLMKRALGL